MTNPSPASRAGHASYRRHRRQVWIQILLPVILACLIGIALIVLISLSTFNEGGDVGRWAAISSMWLMLPAMVAESIVVVALSALIYVLGRISGLIPRYSLRGQQIVRGVEAGTKRAGEMIRQPMLAVRGLGSLVRSRFER
jgi:hypothetical protein